MAVFGPKYQLLVLLGPTASGKSALALTLAERMTQHVGKTAEILSVDSMQLYRGMDVGTAKPTPDERARVPHHLIDVADPNESLAVARFVELADAVIADARTRGVPLIVTGGTPLYYKSLFEGLFDGPPADEALRSRLSAEPVESLHARLLAVDPATRIHQNDRKRVIRALEVYELTGRPISAFQTEWDDPTMRYEATWVGLEWDREKINRRINARAREMMAAGWLDETRSLLERYGTLSKTASEATGYHELIDHLQGRLSLDDAVERIKIATRQLARKQMKWFRRFRNVTWIPGEQPLSDLVEATEKLWLTQTP